MGYAIYTVGKRWGGYGVPATCEYPTCRRVINRGMSFACGGKPFSERGCDRYFCEKHKYWATFNLETGKKCRHKNDCECEVADVCERCRDGKSPFPYKAERKKWVKHLLKDESWAEWRDKNPEEVESLTNQLN